MLLTGILAGIIFAMLLGVAILLYAKQVEWENKIVESYMKASGRFMDEMKGRIEATRHYRHDLSNYIQLLEFWCEKEEPSEIMQEHLRGQKEAYARLREQKICRDEFINAIVQMKKEECQEKGIDFRVEVADGDYSGMEEIDKVCLFLNLLDNAIEATEKVREKEKRTICLRVGMVEETLRVCMENDYAPEDPFSFFTTKADKENHGIGTAIITRIIRKYHGERKTEADEAQGVFRDIVSISLSGGEI